MVYTVEQQSFMLEASDLASLSSNIAFVAGPRNEAPHEEMWLRGPSLKWDSGEGLEIAWFWHVARPYRTATKNGKTLVED